MANLIRRNDPRETLPTTWEPFGLMRELMNWDPFGEMLPSVARGEPVIFTPRFEVKETRDAYVFKADLPGLEEKDLDLSLTGNRLTVSGTRELERRDENDRYYAWERSYGSFSRSFTLPEGADVDHADAELTKGVLTLTIPKKSEHQPRKLTLRTIGDKVKAALGGKEQAGA